MKNMEIIEYLENVRKYEYAVTKLLDRKTELRTLAEKVTAGEADGMPHAQGISDKVGNLSAKLVDLEADIDRAIDKYVDHKTTVCAQLAQLPTVQYQVLYGYYIEYKTLSQIADEIFYTTTHTGRLKDKALETFKDMFGDVVECYTIPVV